MEMDSDSSVDTYLMDSTHIDEFIEDKGQRLMFVFDMLTDRAFFIELKDIELNNYWKIIKKLRLESKKFPTLVFNCFCVYFFSLMMLNVFCFVISTT